MNNIHLFWMEYWKQFDKINAKCIVKFLLWKTLQSLILFSIALNNQTKATFIKGNRNIIYFKHWIFSNRYAGIYYSWNDSLLELLILINNKIINWGIRFEHWNGWGPNSISLDLTIKLYYCQQLSQSSLVLMILCKIFLFKLLFSWLGGMGSILTMHLHRNRSFT